MKKSIVLFALITLLGNYLYGQKIEVSVDRSETDFFKKNVAFFDARVRSIDTKSYVREIYLIDFSKSGWKKVEIYFEGKKFNDDGKGLDKAANDGLFTSSESFPHTAVIPYNAKVPVSSGLANPIIDPGFAHKDELITMRANYMQIIPFGTTVNVGGSATIDCDVEWVCGCWGSCCGPIFKNCHIIFGW